MLMFFSVFCCKFLNNNKTDSVNSNVNGIEMRSNEDFKVHTYNNENLMKVGGICRKKSIIDLDYIPMTHRYP